MLVLSSFAETLPGTIEMPLTEEVDQKSKSDLKSSEAKRQIKPPQYLDEYEIEENQKTTNDFKKSKPDQKSIDSIDQQKRKSTNKLQDVKVIVCTNKIIPDIENEKNVDQPAPISQEAPISSSTKPSEAFLQTISSGMI